MSSHSVVPDEEVGRDDEFLGPFVGDDCFPFNKVLSRFEVEVPVLVDGGGVPFPELVHLAGVVGHLEESQEAVGSGEHD